MEIAPDISPASPARRTTPGAGSAPATPRIRPMLLTRPSLTPNTAAPARPARRGGGARVVVGPGSHLRNRGPTVSNPAVPPYARPRAHPLRPRPRRPRRAAGGEPRYRVDQVWDGLHRQLAEPAELTTLPKALRTRLDAELPAALDPVAESADRRRRHREVAVRAGRRRPGRDRAHALPRPHHRVRVDPGRLRHGLRVLRHRPGRVPAPAHHRRDRRAGGPGRPPGGTRPAGWATWCSWAWASRWPTTTGCGPRSAHPRRPRPVARHLTLSTVGSCRASAAWPARTCR